VTDGRHVARRILPAGEEPIRRQDPSRAEGPEPGALAPGRGDRRGVDLRTGRGGATTSPWAG
jgi:hypothetical protein